MGHAMPRVFLSSAHNEFASGKLQYFHIRNAIHDIGEEEGVPVWIAEEAAKKQPELMPGTENWAGPIMGCVEELHKSDLLIVILASRPGTPYILPFLGKTAASVLEIELFFASYLEIPTVFYCVKGCDPEPELEKLIDVLELKNNNNWHVLDEGDILTKVRSLLQELKKERNISEWRLRYIPDRLAQFRMKSKAKDEALSTELTMVGRFSPAGKHDFNEHRFYELFEQSRAAANKSRYYQLSFLWMAIRELSTGNFNDVDRLPLWQDIMKEWGSTSAWLGLHGYMNTGTIAALHTQAHLRQRGATQAIPYGGLASALYSVGKRFQAATQKRRIFQRSAKLATLQMQADPSGICGCLSIRASARMQIAQLNRPWVALEGLHDYYRAYKWSQKLGHDDHTVGFALVEFAYAQFKLANQIHWRKSEALRRMRDGVAMTEVNSSTGNAGTIVRVKRRYAECLHDAKRCDEANEELRNAREIARAHGLADQVRQLDETESSWK